jgi:hypothetical protein
MTEFHFRHISMDDVVAEFASEQERALARSRFLRWNGLEWAQNKTMGEPCKARYC